MSDERIFAQVGTRARPAPVTGCRFVAYEYRARVYPWAEANIAEAMAEHGTPGPKPRPPRPCKCGCGGEVPGVTGRGRQAEYLEGHQPHRAPGRATRPAGSDRATVLVRRVPVDDKPRCDGCGYLTTRCSCPGGAR